MSFGSKLRELRVAAGMTQEQLAKKINLSKANVSKYEADTVEPNLDTLVAISNLFGVTIDYMLDVEQPIDNTSTAIPTIIKEYLPIIKYISSLPKDEQPQAKVHFKEYVQFSKEQRKEVDNFTEYIKSKKGN